jgi:hypothetical protein
LREPRFLIKPNVAQRIRIIAKGNLIQFYRDEEKLFELNDPQPYMRGHFGFRTVANHMRVVGFRVQRLKSSE